MRTRAGVGVNDHFAKIIGYAVRHNGSALFGSELRTTARNGPRTHPERVSSQVGSVRQGVQLPPRPLMS